MGALVFEGLDVIYLVPNPNPLDSNTQTVVKAIIDGRLVPFLGAGANLCGRPEKANFKKGEYLPSGAELASYLADNFNYPADEPKDLLRVAQYVALGPGSGPLYQELREVFDADYPITPLHRLLAKIPGILRKRKCRCPYELIVTTNYDDLLERAFDEVDEPFDLVKYLSDGNERGKFVHQSPDGNVCLIEKPNEYPKLTLEERSVIMKIHGAVDRANSERDSFVITEDHYIDYLTRTDISEMVPVKLTARLRKSNFLFLGYSLSDWNLRVILYRIWRGNRLTYNSWAIQLDPNDLDRRSWEKRGVEIIKQPLEDYVATLDAALKMLPELGGMR